MANALNNYNPTFYANEALIHLMKGLGMASRVHLGYDAERRSFDRGDVVTIRKPSTFTVANAPDATGQDLVTEKVNITLNQWKEVKFKLTDKELAFTGQRIIDEHISPAAYALADNIDQALAALYTHIPHWATAAAGVYAPVDIISARKVLRDNNVPMDNPSLLHLMIGSDAEADFLGNAAFSQQQGAGDAGVNTQLRGSLGMKYGLEPFVNQNTPTFTKSGSALNDLALVTNGAAAIGATTINFDETTLTGTLEAGDYFTLAGDTQKYAVTAAVTASGNALTGVTFTPALKKAAGDGTVVTVVQAVTAKEQNLAFHRNAFALVTAPLSDIGARVGAQVSIAVDPVTGLSLRSRIYYVGNSSEVHVALDVLYGVACIEPNLACRLIGY